jgi:barstar (barnase inhibitor)
MLFAEDLARVSWRCVHFAATTTLSDELRRELTEQQVMTFALDGASVGGKADLMAALAAALRFPGYFGGNWDAVAECLRDLPEAIPGEGYVLFIGGGYRLLQAQPVDAARLVEVWLSAAEDASHDNIAMHLVFLGWPKG